jgi:hypothetical protein
MTEIRRPRLGGTEPDLVTIRTFDDELEANLAKSALQAARIDCMISRDDCGGMRPSLSVGSAIKLLVRADDADQANEVLAKKGKRSKRQKS